MTLILDVGDSGVDSDGGAFGEGEGSGGDGFEIVFDCKDETCPGGASLVVIKVVVHKTHILCRCSII